MTSPAEIADRRAKVRQLAQTGASNRQIAAELAIGKDTVARDLAAPMTKAERLALQVAQAEAAVAQACAAAQTVEAARPAYTLTDDATARRWYDTLRAAAAQLLSQAGAFTDYYASATVAEPAPQGAA